MRKIIALLSVVSVVCSFAACSKTDNKAEDVDVDNSVVEFNMDSPDEAEPVEEAESEADSDSEANVEPAEAEEAEGSSSQADEQESGEDEEPDSDKSSQTAGEVYEFGGVTIEMPEGFTVDESVDKMVSAFCPNYPEEGDVFTITETNESIAVYSEENINKTMKAIFSDYDGCRNYLQYTIDGCQAVSYDQTITVNHMEVPQKQVVVFADDTIIFTFSDVSGNCSDTFKKAIDSIKVVE